MFYVRGEETAGEVFIVSVEFGGGGYRCDVSIIRHFPDVYISLLSVLCEGWINLVVACNEHGSVVCDCYGAGWDIFFWDEGVCVCILA